MAERASAPHGRHRPPNSPAFQNCVPVSRPLPLSQGVPDRRMSGTPWIRQATEQVPSQSYGSVDLERHHLVRADRQFSTPGSPTVRAARSDPDRHRWDVDSPAGGGCRALPGRHRTTAIAALRGLGASFCAGNTWRVGRLGVPSHDSAFTRCSSIDRPSSLGTRFEPLPARLSDPRRRLVSSSERLIRVGSPRRVGFWAVTFLGYGRRSGSQSDYSGCRSRTGRDPAVFLPGTMCAHSWGGLRDDSPMHRENDPSAEARVVEGIGKPLNIRVKRRGTGDVVMIMQPHAEVAPYLEDIRLSPALQQIYNSTAAPSNVAVSDAGAYVTWDPSDTFDVVSIHPAPGAL